MSAGGETEGLLSTEQMVAELYRTVCVSRNGQPCLVDQVFGHGKRLDGHDQWIEKHDSRPETPLITTLIRAGLVSIVSSLSVSLVGVVGWGLVTVLRRALLVP